MCLLITRSHVVSSANDRYMARESGQRLSIISWGIMGRLLTAPCRGSRNVSNRAHCRPKFHFFDSRLRTKWTIELPRMQPTPTSPHELVGDAHSIAFSCCDLLWISICSCPRINFSFHHQSCGALTNDSFTNNTTHSIHTYNTISIRA